MMLVYRIIMLLGIGVAREVNYPDPANPCGADIGPCPSDDLYCRLENATVSKIKPCEGTCAYKNTYSSCGGFRPDPKPCGVGQVCRDDPRSPDSCGMACDRPGVCLPAEHFSCGILKPCPAGLWCYQDASGGKKNSGICM